MKVRLEEDPARRQKKTAPKVELFGVQEQTAAGHNY